MADRKPLTEAQREAKNRRARELRAEKKQKAPQESGTEATESQQDAVQPPVLVLTDPPPARKHPPALPGIPEDPPPIPRYLISRDNRAYLNPQHPENGGRMDFVGYYSERLGKDGEVIREVVTLSRTPANKKERRKARQGLPFRDTQGKVE